MLIRLLKKYNLHKKEKPPFQPYLFNQTGLQPVSRPVERVHGTKMCSKMCSKMFKELTAPRL